MSINIFEPIKNKRKSNKHVNDLEQTPLVCLKIEIVISLQL